MFMILGCQSEESEMAPSLAQQIAGAWQLNSLDATIQVDGEDYTIFLAQFAEFFGLAPEELAIGLLFLESQITQELLAREPTLRLNPEYSFDFQQIDAEPLRGSWEINQDSMQLVLISEAQERLALAILSLDENEMKLMMSESSGTLFGLPQFPEQLELQLEMDWSINQPTGE
jgi:hypothetical protein